MNPERHSQSQMFFHSSSLHVPSISNFEVVEKIICSNANCDVSFAAFCVANHFNKPHAFIRTVDTAGDCAGEVTVIMRRISEFCDTSICFLIGEELKSADSFKSNFLTTSQYY